MGGRRCRGISPEGSSCPTTLDTPLCGLCDGILLKLQAWRGRDNCLPCVSAPISLPTSRTMAPSDEDDDSAVKRKNARVIDTVPSSPPRSGGGISPGTYADESELEEALAQLEEIESELQKLSLSAVDPAMRD